ncbi:hypothetical protein IFM89_017430 [Coptis chinensis]|uniref:Uncharacterized protein n=1 Tax=Coptis chinensis TaxID=261450 RepID=A0A835LML2_9MAGN|nr:hypothetical protein IFM89_017430 [Coptis chinensis]
MTPLLNDHNSYEDILESESLPFMKSSPGWKHVESSEAFRLMPQKPHFQPLEKQHAFLREGEALGLMVSFANLVEKTRKVHHDELKCVLEDLLDLVSYFKPFGFNVQPIQARLDELLRDKEKEVQLDGELKQVQEKIMNDKIEEEALISDIDKRDEKLRELQKSIDEISKERELLMKEKQTTGSMISSSLNMHNEIEKEMQRMKAKFDSITTAPW